MRTNIIILLMLNLMLSTYISAQVTIGSDNPPHESAILDLQSSNKGFLVPRVALTGRYDKTTIPDAVPGLLVINTAQANMNQPEDERVYPYKFYYWIEGDKPGWERFIGQDELEYRIDQEITKWAVPLPVMFYLNGSDMLSDNRPGIHDFMGNVTTYSAIEIPLRDSINHSEGYVKLKEGTQSTLIFKPGIYNIIFAYLFIPTTSLTSSCKDSSYFMDFPFYPKEGGNAKSIRVYSNTYHNSGDMAAHAGTINFIAPIREDTEWVVKLGAGKSSCTNVNGFALPNRNTFLYITRVGDW